MSVYSLSLFCFGGEKLGVSRIGWSPGKEEQVEVRGRRAQEEEGSGALSHFILLLSGRALPTGLQVDAGAFFLLFNWNETEGFVVSFLVSGQAHSGTSSPRMHACSLAGSPQSLESQRRPACVSPEAHLAC